MLIDWVTVGAQILNFAVLVWLLKRLLYRRILRAIDERESRIARETADAEAREAEARKQLAAYEAKLADWEQQRQNFLEQARRDAEQQQATMLEQARERIHRREQKWREELDWERLTFVQELRRRIAAETLSIARHVIAELTCSELEQCAIQAFLRKIRSLDRTDWSRFGDGAFCVRTPLEVPEHQRGELRQAIEESLGRPVELRFEQSAGTGLGLELVGNGWRIEWSSETWFRSLEEDFDETLNKTSRTSAAAEQEAG
jgi:F-type H+-transporting ATPase subunit b